jgi:transposase
MVYLFKKIKNSKICWYLGESRRENGKVRRIWQKYLGTAENVGEALKHGTFPEETDILEFGLCAALLEIDKEIQFKNAADKILKKREQGLSYGEHLLLTIINRIDNPTSKNKLSTWFDSTILKRIFTVKKEYLSSQNFWNHWNHISEDEINKIQEVLLKKIIPLVNINNLVYDPTNFTTYIEEHKDQKLMQFGHAKDKRRLRQVNLALLVTKEEGIPLWHHTYEGNTNDVTEFKNFIKTLTERISIFSKKCKKITIIFDKGNDSKNNIKNVNKKLSFFIVGSLKPSEHAELFDIPLEEFKEKYLTGEGKEVICTSRLMDIYDGKKKIVITYSEELAYKNKIRVEKALNKAVNQLKNIQARLKNSTLTRDELLIKVSKIADKQWIKGLLDYKIYGTDKSFSLEFKENGNAYENMGKRFGKNILFTDDLSLNAEDIVKLYSDKYIVEEQIKNLKDRHVISFTPAWCWTDKMIRVHAFTCVMALLFLRFLCIKAGGKHSQDTLIEQLKKIKLTLIKMPKSNEIKPQISRLNDIGRELANKFNLRKYI